MGGQVVEPPTASDAQFRAAFEYALDAMVIFDDTGRFLEVNDAACRVFGLPAGELVGIAGARFIVPGQRARVAQVWAGFLAQGQLQGEVQLYRADHTIRDIEFNLVARILPGRHLAVIRDITARKRAAAALEESQRSAATLMSNLPGMAYRCRGAPPWTIEFVSDGCLELTGYPPAALINHAQIAYGDLIHPEDRPLVWREVEAAVAEQRPFQVNYRITTATGDEKHVWERGVPVPSGTGAEIMLEGFATDVTARWRAEQARHRSDSRFAKIFRASPDAMGLSLLATGEIIDVNDSWVQITGYNRDEVLGRSGRSLNLWVDAVDRARLVAGLQERGSIRDLEVRFRRKSGEIRQHSLSAEILEIDGEPCLLTITRDVTARKEADAALRQSEDRFAKAFRAGPDPLNITRLADQRILDVNERWLEVTGYRRDEVIGRTALELHLWVDPAARDRVGWMLREQGFVREEEIAFRMKSGEIRHCLTSIELIETGGEACVLTMARDITTRKQAEDALRQSEERFAKAFRASPDGISIARRADSVLIDVNDSWLDLFGYRREEVLGTTASGLGIWPDPVRRAQVLSLLQEQGSVHDLEIPLRHKSGTIRQFMISIELITIGGEECLLSISRDITARKQAEEALRQSEERFATAFSASPDGMTIASSNLGMILDVNESWLALFGYRRDEVLGVDSKMLDLWVDLATRKRVLALLQEQGFARDIEVPLRRKSGEIRQILFSAERIMIGTEPCTLTVCRDITARKQVEEALRRSEERFAKAFHATPDAIIIVRLNDERILDANESALRLSGYSREEVIGNTIPGLGLHIDPARGAEMLVLLREHGFVRDMDFRFRRKSGAAREALISMELIEIDGEPCRLVIVRDVTEQRQALAQSRLLEAAVRNAGDAIIIINADFADGFHVVFGNPSFVKQTGYTLDDLAGSHIRALLGPRTDPAVINELTVALLAGQPFHGEMINYRKDRSEYIAEWDLSPIRDAAGRVTHWVSLQRDITERREMEERARASEHLRALGQVAAGVAHEFNNVLAGIMGRLDLLAMAHPDPATADTLRVFQQAVEDGAAMVGRIQRFARKTEPGAFQTVSVSDLVQDVVALTQPRWRADQGPAGRPISMQVHLESGLAVLGTATELREVLTNLILNAVDALPQGGQIVIRSERRGAQVALIVRDTGVGMDPAVRERIFDPFYTTKMSGSGLGLAIVKNIVQNHQGTIEVVSSPGGGTAFTVRLPAADLAPPAPAPAPAPVAPSAAARILAVDDDPALGDMLRLMLGAAGHEVVVATSGPAALALLEEGRFDLVCTDLGMPGMNGWEVARRVREQAPATPVVMITGWGIQLDPAELAANGITSVLFKPYRMHAVQDMVAQALAGKGGPARHKEKIK